MTIKRLHLLILSIMCIGIHQVRGMETTQDAILLIKNETGQKLEVTYHQLGKLHKSTLVNRQEDVVNDFFSVKELYIAPYGKVRGWVTSSSIPGEFFKNNLLKTVEDLKIAQLKDQSTQLTIKPGGGYLSYVVGKELAGEVSPYQYDVLIIEAEEFKKIEKKEIGTLLDYFPQVKAAVQNEKRVLPRYFLNIGEGASKEAIESAHEKLRLIWQEKKDSPIPAEAQLAGEVLEILQAAYSKLQNIHNGFDSLTKAYQPRLQEYTDEEKAQFKITDDVFMREWKY